MLIRLNTKIGYIVKHACLLFEKIYRAVLKIFATALKLKNYHSSEHQFQQNFLGVK